MRVPQLLRVAWAAPCSAIGLVLGGVLLLAGGRARVVDGAVEIALRPARADCGRRLAACKFRAITFGHVILGVTGAELDAYRAHEQVHVRQYERLGPLFLLAYPLASLWAWWRGGDPYWHNRFEVEARRHSATPPPASR